MSPLDTIDATHIALAMGVVFVGALVQGSVGFGLALVAAPILALVDPRLVPGPMVAAASVMSFLMTYRERRFVQLSRVGWGLVGRVPGMIAGLAALAFVPTATMRIVFAALVLLAVVMSAAGGSVSIHRRSLLVAGTLSGFMGTTTSIGGPPMALLYQNDPGARVRANLSAYFTAGTTMSLVGLVAIGRYGAHELGWTALLLPAIVIGFLASGRTARRLDSGFTRAAILVVSATAGAVVLGRELV